MSEEFEGTFGLDIQLTFFFFYIYFSIICLLIKLSKVVIEDCRESVHITASYPWSLVQLPLYPTARLLKSSKYCLTEAVLFL